MPAFKPVSVASAKNRVRVWLDHFRCSLCLDFGSAQTRLIKDGELIWQQPTLLAWHEPQQAVLAIGQAADQLSHQTSQAIKLIRPIQRGVVADLKFASLYLESIFKATALDKAWSQFLPKLVTTAYPLTASPVEKKQLQQVLQQAGCQPAALVSKSEALAALPILQKINAVHGLLAVGAETLEIGIFADHQLLTGRTFYQPNHRDLTRVIQELVLSQYQLKIDKQTAQRLKFELVNLVAESTTAKLTVKGKNIQRQQIVTERVEAAKLQIGLQKIVEAWASRLDQFLSQIPPTIKTQLQEQGLYLTGGGSQIGGLAQFLSEELQLPIFMSQQPELDLVKGLWWHQQQTQKAA